MNRANRFWLWTFRTANRNRCGPSITIEQYVYVRIVIAGFVNFSRQRSQFNSLHRRRTRGRCHQFRCAILHRFGKICRRYDFVHQTPGSCAFAFHTIWIGAEHVGKIATHFALVHHPCKSAGSRQHTKQRSFRQAHGAGAIVDQENFVARERQFVASARGGTVQRGEKFQAVVAAGIFHAIAGFVGKFAEIYFPGVRRAGQHINVCTCAKHSFFGTGNDHTGNFRMFESDSLQRVVQFDVHAKVVGIQL